MLKLKRIDLLTKNDKIHKNGCCDHVQKYKKLECLCWEDGRVGMGGCLQFGKGEVGWGRRGRRRRNRGRECRQSGYILTFTDGIMTDTFCWYTRRWFRWWQCHITEQISRFESLGHSVGKIIWKKSTSSHRCNFPKKLYSPSALRSVYTDERILSVYTDRIADGCSLSVYSKRCWDGIITIGKNYWRKNFIGNSVGFRWFSGSVWSYKNSTKVHP